MKIVFGFLMTIFLTSALFAQNHPVTTVDAMLDFTGKNGKIFFFKNDNYWRFDLKANRLDKGYPNKIKRGFIGLKNYPKLGIDFSKNLDAALNRNNKHCYFFKGAYYVKYDMATKKVMSGYPKKIAGNWSLPKEFTKNIDASYSRYDERVYFFKGSKYVRYNLKTKKVDPGYPANTNSKYSLGSFGAPKAACKISINNAAYLWDNSGRYFKFNTKTNKKFASYYPAKVNQKSWNFLDLSGTGNAPISTAKKDGIKVTKDLDLGLTVYLQKTVNNAKIILHKGHNEWVMLPDGGIVLKDNQSYGLTVLRQEVKNGARIILHKGYNKWKVLSNGAIVLENNSKFGLTVNQQSIKEGSLIILHEGYNQWSSSMKVTKLGNIKVKDKNGVPVLAYSYNNPSYSFETSCSVPDYVDKIDITGSTTMYRDLFAPACEQHDINYRAPWRIAGFSGYAGKEIADEIFKKDMEKLCEVKYNNFVSETYCKTAASTWFTAVNTTSQARKAFDEGQKKANEVVRKSSVSKGGFISVKSDAGYITKVKVNYVVNGKRQYKSGTVSLGFTKEFGIPLGATSIKLNVEGVGCGLSFSKSFSYLVTKCYKVWGTIIDTEWRELKGCK
jgi:hypothetical protein